MAALLTVGAVVTSFLPLPGAAAAETIPTAASGAPAVSSSAPSPGAYTPVTATRVLDTRIGLGSARAPLGVAGSVSVRVAGAAGIPATGVGAVVATVTVTGTRGSGYLTAYPSGRARPTASTLNWASGATVSNTAILPVGSDGRIALFNGSSGVVDAILDVGGWYAAGTSNDPGTYRPIGPVRVRDTRTGVGGPKGPLLHVVDCVTFTVALAGLTPGSASAVAVNVTVTNTSRPGSLGRSDIEPGVIHWRAGETVAHLAVVPLFAGGTTGELCMAQNGPVDVVVDLVGAYVAGQPMTAGRSVVLSEPQDVPTLSVPGTSQHPSVASVTVKPTFGSGTPPSGQVAALMLEVTVGPTWDDGLGAYLTGRATGSAPVSTSLMNWKDGRPESALVVLPVGPDGSVTLSFSPGYSAQLGVELVGVVLARQPILSDAWRVTAVPLPPLPVLPGELSCVTGAVCAAALGYVGSKTTIARRDQQGWHDLVDMPASGTSPHVGCAGSGLCVASAIVPDGTPTPASLLKVSTPSSTWTSLALPQPAPGVVRIIGVGCAATGASCWVVGLVYGTAADGTSHNTPYAAVMDSSGWRSLSVPLPPGAPSGGLGSVTCRTDDDCLAVGSFTEAQGGELDLAVHWDGARWSDASPPLPSTGNRRDLTKPSATADGYLAMGWKNGVAHWVGGSWSFAPTRTGGVASCLTTAVTCFTAGGPTLTQLPADVAVPVTSADVFAGFVGVAAPSCAASTCAAPAQPVLGPLGQHDLVLRLVDGHWIAETLPLPEGHLPLLSLSYFSSPSDEVVSCWGDGACLLLGPDSFSPQPDGTFVRAMDEAVLTLSS